MEETVEQIADNKFWADIEQRTKDITAKMNGRKVFPIVLLVSNEPREYAVAYAYEPDLLTQMKMVDMSSAKGVDISLEVCSQTLDSLLIASESDERIAGRKNANFWKGACMALGQFFTANIPVIKKK